MKSKVPVPFRRPILRQPPLSPLGYLLTSVLLGTLGFVHLAPASLTANYSMDHPQPSTSAVHRFFRVPKFIWRKLRNYWKPTIPERRVARPPSIHVRQVPNPMNYLRPEPISPDDRSSFFFFTGSAPTLRRRFTDDDHYSYTEAGHGSSPVSRSVSRLDIRERPRVPPLP